MTKPTPDDRREQLIACAEAVAALATNRNIVAQHVSKVEADHEVRRVLDAIVKRFSVLSVPLFFTEGSLGGKEAKRQKEHVVPCRVLVDRMIMNPVECRALLESAVVLAEVSGDEHRALGGIYANHPDLYAEMLITPVSDLPDLGLQRYKRAGIVVHGFVF